MLNFCKGKPIAKITGGKHNGQILYLDDENSLIKNNKCNNCECEKCSKKCLNKKCCKKCNMEDEYSSSEEYFGKNFKINKGTISQLPGITERSVHYIAGPSGSGKSTYAANLVKVFKKIYPKNDFFIFSRSDVKNDPSFKKLKYMQIPIDEDIIENPIDITKEITAGSIILFDDCNTIQNDKHKKEVDKLMADIMEIGRKLNIWIIITNHLVIPNEKKIARTIMNEMQHLTVFPKSGSSQQIRYCLKQYYGLNNNQIDQILNYPSRWITISKNYPMCIMHEKGVDLI